MRQKLFELADVLDYALLNPLQFTNAWEDTNIAWGSYGKLFSVLAGFSLAIGTYYISPPYLQNYIVPILMGAIANALILLVLPLVVGSLMDHFAQERERNGRSKMMVEFAGITQVAFLLYAPLCILFQAIGLQGFFGSLVAMLLVFGGFAFLNSRGIKYIYDLKDQDAIRYAFTALGVSFFYPFLFNFYLTNYIMNFTL